MRRTLLFVSIMLVLGFFRGGAAQADDTYQFVSAWGAAGAADGSFNEPAGITVDQAGKILVADSKNNRIQQFSPAGVFEAAYGSAGTAPGQFSRPLDVAATEDGGLVVADTDNDRIQRYDPEDREWKVITVSASPLSKPEGIALGSGNVIFVSDTAHHVVKKINRQGGLLLAIGSAGSLDGQFESPTDVALDSLGNIYVADCGNNRIQKFSPAGAFLAAWGSYGVSGNGFFNGPRSLAVDTQDNIFVTDTLNSRIQKFSSAGAFLGAWGQYGTVNNGDLNQPRGIALDGKENVLVADTLNNRIQKFEFVNTPLGLAVSVCNALLNTCVTFAEVTTGGHTTISALCAARAPALPVGETLLFAGRIISVETTAVYSAPVQVCITYGDANLTPLQESELGLFWYDDVAKAWVNITGTLDTINNKICGQAQKTGLFALAYPETAVKATVNISPETLNLKSKGNFITATIRFPAGYDARCVDKNSIVLSTIDAKTVPALTTPSSISYSVKKGAWQMMVKFERSAVQAIVVPGSNTLTISGGFACNLTGIVFEGSDTIRVIPVVVQTNDKAKGKK